MLQESWIRLWLGALKIQWYYSGRLKQGDESEFWISANQKTDTAKAYQGIELNVQILKVAENCRYLDNTIDVGGCAVDSVSVRTDEVSFGIYYF